MAMQGGQNLQDEELWAKTGKFAGMDTETNAF
jgi:hypothetical protein